MRKIGFILLSLNLLSGPVFAMQMHSPDGCESQRENVKCSDFQNQYCFSYNQSNQYSRANEGCLTDLSVCEYKMSGVALSCCMNNLTKKSLHQNTNKVVLGGINSHSDKHMLYAGWTKRVSLLVTREHPEKSNKLYNQLDKIINHLKTLDNKFVSVDKLL